MRRAGRKQAFVRMLNRFILRMLTQKYRYVKRYFYVLEGQRDRGSGPALVGREGREGGPSVTKDSNYQSFLSE